MRGHVPDPSGSSCSKQPQRDIRIAGCKVGIARNTGQGRRHRLLSHAGRHSGYTGFKLLLCLYLCGTNIASNPQKRGSVACPTAQLVTIDLFPMIHDGKSRKLPFDPAEAIKHLKTGDPKLGALIDKVGEFKLRLDPAPSPFESLLESILYQQLHGKGRSHHPSPRARILPRRSDSTAIARHAG